MTVGQTLRFDSSSRMEQVTHRKRSLKIREALEEVVSQAADQQRLVQGILDTTSVLDSHPTDVMFVVLEQAEKDRQELVIEEKLIQAYCMEKCVKFIKVNKCSPLLRSLERSVLTTQELAKSTETVSSVTPDTNSNCLLDTPNCESPIAGHSCTAIQNKETRNNSAPKCESPIAGHSCTTIQTEESRLDPVHCILIRNPQKHSMEDMFLTSFYEALVENQITLSPFIRV